MKHSMLSILMGSLLLVGCGGGNESSNSDTVVVPPSVPAKKMSATLDESHIKPNEKMKIKVQYSDGSIVQDLKNIELHAELGQISDVSIPFEIVSNTEISFNAPIGILKDGLWGAGVAKLYVKNKTVSNELTEKVNLTIDNIELPALPDGELSIVYLKSFKELFLQAVGNYAILDSKTDGAYQSQITEITQSFNQQIDLIDQQITKIEKVQQGEELLISTVNGQQIKLTKDSLKQLDYLNFVMLGITPKSQSVAKAKSLSAQVENTNDFDIKAIAQDISKNFQDITQKEKSGISLALTGVALLGGVTALPATVLGATAYFVLNFVPAAISMSIEGGSSAILDGKAKFDDFKSGIDAYSDLVKNSILDKITNNEPIKIVLGETWDYISTQTANNLDKIDNFYKNDVSIGFENGVIPINGYTQSQFTLTATANYSGAGSYSVAVSTTPITSGANIKVQISGTDGFRYTQNAVTINGIATFSGILAGHLGVRDTINAFDNDGKAQAATTLIF